MDTLINALLVRHYALMLETNGSLPLDDVPPEVRVVMDLKTPGSGQHEKMNYRNLTFLEPHDEIKFVLTDRRDYNWARRTIKKYHLGDSQHVIFSPAFGLLDPADLARSILRDRLPVRLGLQIHKYIFGPEAKKV